MKQILIVDDNISILKQIAAQVAGGYDVFLAKSGDLALQICVKEKPSLILLDIEMPGMDGFELMYRLRHNPLLDQIPVIFLTANQDQETALKCLETGARDCITKPLEKTLLLRRIETQLALAEFRSQAEAALSPMADSFTITFAKMVDRAGERSGGHVERTTRNMELLCRELIRQGQFTDELTEAELPLIARASLLHDIGKVAISDRIILKSGRLDDDEFTAIKRHTVVGAAILERMYRRMPSLRYLRYAELIAESHHERYDGRGYPRGLAGDNIPLAGRLMAVVDVYNALVEKRHYRGSMSHEQAVPIVMQGKGSQFDPRIVDAFGEIQLRING